MFLLDHIIVTHFQTWCRKKRNFLHFYLISYYEQQPVLWFKSANKMFKFLDSGENIFPHILTLCPTRHLDTTFLLLNWKRVISGHGNETKNLSPVRSQTLTSTQLKNIWSAAVWTAPAEDIGRVQTGSQETRPNSFPNHMTSVLWGPQILPALPKDEFILMVSCTENRLHHS